MENSKYVARKHFFGSVFMLLTVALSAQPQGFKPLQNEAAFRESFTTAGKSVTSIQSDFVQEKNLSMLEETIVSKGKFSFKKDNKVRLEYTTPYQYLMVINGDEVVIKDDKRTNRLSAKSNKMFRQINEIIVDCLGGTALGNPNYSIKAFEGKGQYALELTPTSKTLKEFFDKITVFVEKGDYSVDRLEMRELSGDNTVMKFTQKELNGKIPDSMFLVKN
ncbi:MAG: outer membrane lipoprotein carrier protein LolA [Saprospiraceae bacterium]|nr:outer membrane lipoprotein carrier protein LolA [Saprospiraceae bacterium]